MNPQIAMALWLVNEGMKQIPQSNCNKCSHKLSNKDPNLHCYMFEKQVDYCAQFKQGE